MNLWTLIRPYFTVSRVVALVTALVTPPAALAIGKLAVVTAEWGINLDPTQTLVVFLAGVAAVVGTFVRLATKWLDNRAGFEQALIEKGQAELIGSKGIASIVQEQGLAPPDPDTVVRLETEPAPLEAGGSLATPTGPPDADYLASQPDGEYAEPDDRGPARVSPSTDPTKLPDADL